MARTMVERMLDLADQLAREGSKSSAVRRRAVSTAYYAVFHALAKSCADSLLQSQDKSTPDRYSEEYARVYRALEHGSLKKVFAQNGPLKSRASLRKIGDIIVPLRSERFRADYSPPIKSVFTAARSRELVSQARIAAGAVQALSAEDRRTLAAWLLFKDIPQ
jgi:hypothetical protein